ncbi:MAG: hypothetical protein JWR14_7754 [Caballeronia sp.]|jgi:hypothetical protein|nr:hypothetical protein [Caballeronia sp.]
MLSRDIQEAVSQYRSPSMKAKEHMHDPRMSLSSSSDPPGS